MIPVLILEGRELKVLSLQYTSEEVSSVIAVHENGDLENFYDLKEICNHSNKIDIKKSLIWRDDENIIKIEKRIEAVEEIMNDIALEYISSSDVFAVMHEMKKEFEQLQYEVIGLKSALKILRGEIIV